MNTLPLYAFLRLGAVALIALTALVGCGPRDPEPPPEPAPKKIVPESYPIRMLFVSYARPKGEKARTKDEAIARANEALAKVRAPGASFEAIAREMSDDSISAPDGGWFGFVADWTGPQEADLVTAARALKVGEVSAPFGERNGQMIIQRLSRDEGRAVEARLVAPVDGVLVPWHDLVKSLPLSDTKDAAYEAAANAVVALRAGTYEIGASGGKLLGGQPFTAPIRRVMPPGFEKVAERVLALKPGEFTDPIETKGGWLIAQRMAYVRCYARHIVVTSETSPAEIKPSKRTSPEAHALAREALDRLRREPGAWDELCRKVSEEPFSKDIGGFVGDLTNTVRPERRSQAPEFEMAIFKLAPGETSDLVETRFGVHIFHRDD